jgi:N,N'-diacetyllegionaminate synthase
VFSVNESLGKAWSDLVERRGGGCLIVAEVAQTHDGSLGQAHAFIDAVTRTGADAIKFQTHLSAAESTPAEPWRVPFSYQDETRYAYWQRMEFTPSQWEGLASHARDNGLMFLSSPFSLEAVDLLEVIGMPAWKIASGEVGNTALLDRVIATRAPVLLSSGMSDLTELDTAVERVRAAGNDVVVLQCATVYPCPPESVGLNLLAEFRDRYGCPVGVSDHSATIYVGLAAVTLGAAVIEVHVTLSREMFGPDVPASLTPAELCQLVEGVRFLEAMLSNPVDKNAAATHLEPTRRLFTRSVVARSDLGAGHVLTADDLVAKKPGTGIPAARLPELVGRRLRRAIARDALVAPEDLEA